MSSHSELKQSPSSGEWEDVTDDDEMISSVLSEESTTTNRARSRRKPGTRTVYIASSSPKKLATPKPRPTAIQTTKSAPPSTKQSKEIEAALRQGAHSGLYYVSDVLSSFLYLIKKPLAIFLAIWVLAAALNALTNQVKLVFAPLCILPGISSSWVCERPTLSAEGGARPAIHADFPSMVEIQSKSFEQLLEESVGGSGLALEIKKAEMATKDLVTLVRVSKLTSKDLLADSLVEFVADAKDTSRGLLKLNAKVNSAVDDILAINDYALRTIEASNDSGSSLMTYIWPFARQEKADALTTAFSQSLAVLSSSLQRLILEGEYSLHALDKLEMQLGTIQDILTREGVEISSAQTDALAELWTRLGGNRAQLRGFADHLRLLRELGGYRTRALAHVVGAMQELQRLGADMEELRERVAAPELVGGEIPVEVHVRSIRSGIERLQEGRLRARESEEEVRRRILGPL